MTVSQRAYRVNGQMESLDATVRVDADGRLLALPVARLAQAENGSVIVTRDGNFAEPLALEFRLVRTSTNPHAFVPTQFAVIQEGQSSVVLPIQGANTGDVLTR